MNTEKDIGKLISERLEEASFVADEKQWDIIAQRLDKKKRKKRFFLILVFLLIGTLGFLLISPSFENLEEEKIDTEAEARPNTTSIENELNNKSDDVHNNIKQEKYSENENAVEESIMKDNDSSIQQENQQMQYSENNHEGNRLTTQTHSEKKESSENKLYHNNSIETKKSSSIVKRTKSSTPKTKKKPEFDSGATTQKTSYYYYNSDDNMTLETENKKVIDSILINSEKLFADEIQRRKDSSSASHAQQLIGKKAGEANLKNDNTKKTEPQDSLKAKKDLHKENTLETVASDSLSVQEEENKKSRWGIRLIGSPTYFNVPHNESVFGEDLEIESTNGQFTFNYGAEVNFEFNKKMSLSLGVLKTKHTNKTNAIITTNLPVDTIIPEESLRVRLKQEIEYLEVPLTFDYTFIGKEKLGLKVMGGFSTHFLTNNNITIEDTGDTFLLFSPRKNLSSISLSLNLGIGFYGEVSENLFFEFRPMYKYHANTYDINTQNTSYSFGLNFGLRYVFDKKKERPQFDLE